MENLKVIISLYKNHERVKMASFTADKLHFFKNGGLHEKFASSAFLLLSMVLLIMKVIEIFVQNLIGTKFSFKIVIYLHRM